MCQVKIFKPTAGKSLVPSRYLTSESIYKARYMMNRPCGPFLKTVETNVPECIKKRALKTEVLLLRNYTKIGMANPLQCKLAQLTVTFLRNDILKSLIGLYLKVWLMLRTFSFPLANRNRAKRKWGKWIDWIWNNIPSNQSYLSLIFIAVLY